MDFSPTWSIGYYFIPVYNIRQPYLAMVDVWKASKDPHNWRAQQRPVILLIWWLIWLLPWIVYVMYAVYTGYIVHALPFDGLHEQLFHYLASDPTSTSGFASIADKHGNRSLGYTFNAYYIVLALLFLVIVNDIHTMQIKQHEAHNKT